MRTMRSALGTLARIGWGPGTVPEDAPWQQLRHEDVTKIRSALVEQTTRAGQPWGSATINKHLAALRGVLKAAWAMGLLSHDAYDRGVQFKPVSGQSVPAGRDVQPGEVAALVAACKATPGALGVRDAAMLALAFTGGLRRSEL